MNNTVEIHEFKERTLFTINVRLRYLTGFTEMIETEKRDFALDYIRNEMHTIAEQNEAETENAI